MNDFFQILNPDWWLDENNNALQIADAILYLLLAIPVMYLLICAFFSMGKYKNPYPQAKIQHRFLVIFAVLRNGKEVIQSIEHFLDTQQYPREKYDIAVAATQLSEEDLIKLLQMPVNIVVPDNEKCTKVYAIQQVMQRYSPDEYDMVVIFNSDNRIVPKALELFNNAYYSGCDAIQAHRMTENLTTNIAILNATSEEINNNLFRKSHTRMGFSSALIGSAMAFDFRMFHEITPTLKGSDLSKSLETALLNQNIYTEYLEEVVCYSKKEENANGYEMQRLNWLRSQYSSTFLAIKRLPFALIRGQWDYSLKLFQWLIPSRFMLIALIALCGFLTMLYDWPLSLKWFALLGIIAMSFLMALPEGEINKRFKRAIWGVPMLILVTLFSHISNIFRKKGK
ncbi:glycosyltransferase family 2 protein [Bacteroides timonensis]|uniref:glycosyltransferase family 2 protein n=1 Tax=Bacteroides timonensis TaxID=1470345 RepID=UPI0004BB2395|nr:glycosyltransferase family 2 protein [Bacteroides timonensis]